MRPPCDTPSPTSTKYPLSTRLRISCDALAFDQPVILEISLREIRPCRRNARITSTSAEFTRMGAVKRESFFFVLVAALGDKFYTIDSKDLFGNEIILG